MKRQLAESLLLACLVSCADQGNDVESLELVSIEPQQNAVNVDKAQRIELTFDQPVHHDELKKVQMRYADDGSLVEDVASACHCALTQPSWFMGPLIWKPGKTIEVIIPNSVSDITGRRLRSAVSLQFTTALDEEVFELSTTNPQTNDTISVGAYGHSQLELTFSDYVPFHSDQISLSPEATVMLIETVDAPMFPTKILWISLSTLIPFETYELTIFQPWTDYEGQSLPREYRVVFHTVP